jgi:acyl-CoA synthetase (AMP-forming)/AMP-acid ligase II
MTIIEMLVENACRYPDETALVEITPSQGLRREVTWKQLEERSSRLAAALIAMGIGKGDRVLHLMKNSIEWLEVYFGIIKTGAWAVPLNFRFTSAEIAYCAGIAEPRAMILGEDFLERVESVRAELTGIEYYILAGAVSPPDMLAYGEILAGAPGGVRFPLSDGEDVCGLYFTSGTTGEPKPIILTHNNMESAAVIEQKHHFQTHDDNFLLLPPLYHTGAKMHWFGSLLTGSRATILTEISPRYILQTVAGESCSIVWLLVPWAQDILLAFDRGELKPEDYDLERWRLMHIGAQPVPPSLVKHWREYFPDMQYDTNYGLSESTGPGCVHLGIANSHKVGAIGLPGFGWQARIVDENGRDVAPGQTGELLVKGSGVMRGYYKNPIRSAQTLRDGWLYTGDIARMDAEGFIYLVDRKKDIVIVGGENLFPVEIEDLLRTHPAVHDAAVIGVPDERLGEIPLAVIKVKPGWNLTDGDIQLFCEQNLPRYKRPRRIVFADVPRNPTGKIEKPRLRQIYAHQPPARDVA